MIRLARLQIYGLYSSMFTPNISEFPSFSLERLLSTCFGSSQNKLKVCTLVDLPDLSLFDNYQFIDNQRFQVQSYGKKYFFDSLTPDLLDKLNYASVDFFAFKTTGGSNLDPDDEVRDADGNCLSFHSDICPNYDLILAVTDYSLTAPLTAMAKKFGFRGATLHGVNDIILSSGLAVDYNQVSKQAEVFRSALDLSDSFELNFEVEDEQFSLKLTCNKQVAQKSHGLCPPGSPDVANLPAGEVYFVPEGAEGSFPFRFSNGTLAEMTVKDGSITHATLLSGDQSLVDSRNKQLLEDPATGIIGELGFGTQLLPFSGRDIQDEKILGTCHVATGRSDHLGGNLTPDLFNSRNNASHDDILFAPPKTPEINVSSVKMNKDMEVHSILENFSPTPFLLDQLESEYPVEKFMVS